MTARVAPFNVVPASLRRITSTGNSRPAGAKTDRTAGTGTKWCRTFLEASTDAEIQQIMMIDAPSVLGCDAWREIDAATSMQLLDEVLTRLVEDGTIERQPVAPLVHLLSGAMNEAALWIAGSDDRERNLSDSFAALDRMLASLRIEQNTSG